MWFHVIFKYTMIHLREDDLEVLSHCLIIRQNSITVSSCCGLPSYFSFVMHSLFWGLANSCERMNYEKEMINFLSTATVWDTFKDFQVKAREKWSSCSRCNWINMQINFVTPSLNSPISSCVLHSDAPENSSSRLTDSCDDKPFKE